MTVGRFAGILAAMLLAALVLVWVLVSLAALAYALSQGDSDAAEVYALFVVIGVAAAALTWWVARRVARARAGRQ